MKIDLSKLKINDLPTKDVEIVLSGKKQTVSIKPLSGKAQLSIATTLKTDNQLQQISLALVDGADMTEKEASLLIEGDWGCALQLASEIYIYTSEYAKVQSEASEQAEKN